jgi:hypothetical protein
VNAPHVGQARPPGIPDEGEARLAPTTFPAGVPPPVRPRRLLRSHPGFSQETLSRAGFSLGVSSSTIRVLAGRRLARSLGA